MNTHTASAQAALSFVVAKQNASEDQPARLGNVDFWHEIPGFPAGLCYSLPVHAWDVQAVQADLNRLAEPVWAELVAHLNPQPVSAP